MAVPLLSNEHDKYLILLQWCSSVLTFIFVDLGVLRDLEDVVVRKVGPSFGVLRLDARMPHSTAKLQLVGDLPDVIRVVVAMCLQHLDSAPSVRLRFERFDRVRNVQCPTNL